MCCISYNFKQFVWILFIPEHNAAVVILQCSSVHSLIPLHTFTDDMRHKSRMSGTLDIRLHSLSSSFASYAGTSWKKTIHVDARSLREDNENVWLHRVETGAIRDSKVYHRKNGEWRCLHLHGAFMEATRTLPVLSWQFGPVFVMSQNFQMPDHPGLLEILVRDDPASYLVPLLFWL